jgi:hypothetical protein
MAVLEMTAARMGGYRGQTREEGLRSAQAADRRYRRIREDALHFLQRRCHNSARQHALWGSRIRTLIATWVAVSLSSPLHTVPYAPLAIHDVREYLRPDVLRHVLKVHVGHGAWWAVGARLAPSSQSFIGLGLLSKPTFHLPCPRSRTLCACLGGMRLASTIINRNKAS